MPLDAESVAVEHKTADEMRAEFRRAQQRRLASQGVVFWRDTELPEHGVIWTEPPQRDKVE